MNPILCLEISLIDMCANMCMLWRSAKAWAGVCLGWTRSCCFLFDADSKRGAADDTHPQIIAAGRHQGEYPAEVTALTYIKSEPSSCNT